MVVSTGGMIASTSSGTSTSGIALLLEMFPDQQLQRIQEVYRSCAGDLAETVNLLIGTEPPCKKYDPILSSSDDDLPSCKSVLKV